MSIQVTPFDERKALAELKSCPKIVRDYVKLLNRQIERLKDLNGKAIGKLTVFEKGKLQAAWSAYLLGGGDEDNYEDFMVWYAYAIEGLK